jgi:hypothetical protein
MRLPAVALAAAFVAGIALGCIPPWRETQRPSLSSRFVSSLPQLPWRLDSLL